MLVTVVPPVLIGHVERHRAEPKPADKTVMGQTW
jgi:hypothetical protein